MFSGNGGRELVEMDGRESASTRVWVMVVVAMMESFGTENT